MSAVAAVLALAAALACWPGGGARHRAAALRAPRRDRPRRGSVAVPGFLGALPVVLVGATAAGALAAGIGGAVAAALLAVTVVRTRRDLRAEREHAEATHGLAEGLGSFAAEVRSGAPLPAAADAAGADAHPVTARAFALVSATARLGGDVPAALRSAGRSEPVAAAHLDRVAAAWALADRHGIALAGPAEAAARDLRARARVAARLRAQLAGPRATATVLALLPLLGVGLGEAIGAHPWAVLSGPAFGQVLLVVGVGLVCAGVAWTSRIAAGVAR